MLSSPRATGKNIAWITGAILLTIIFIYTLAYLSSRKVEFSDDDGTWAVYFYNKAYVRQYALDVSARQLFDLTMKTGTRSYLGGYPGDTGEYWFCVYVEAGSEHYRLFRLAEETENRIYKLMHGI